MLSAPFLPPFLFHSSIIQVSSSKFQSLALNKILKLHDIVYNTSCTETYRIVKSLFPYYDISIELVAFQSWQRRIAMLRRVLSLPLPHQPLLLTILLKVSTKANGAVLADPRRLFWILHARNIFRFRESNFACRARLSNPLSSAITDSFPRLIDSTGRCYPWYRYACYARIIAYNRDDRKGYVRDVRLYSPLRDRAQLYGGFVSREKRGKIGETRFKHFTRDMALNRAAIWSF